MTLSLQQPSNRSVKVSIAAKFDEMLQGSYFRVIRSMWDQREQFLPEDWFGEFAYISREACGS